MKQLRYEALLWGIKLTNNNNEGEKQIDDVLSGEFGNTAKCVHHI